MDIREILRVLPHRYPMLMVDRILEVQPGQRAVGIKNVTINEPIFTGHYPGRPILPGVMILEAMAQVAGVAMLTVVDNREKTPLFAGIDKARFRRVVQPGDQLRVEVEVLRARGSLGRIAATASVDGVVAAEAELLFALGDVAVHEAATG